MRTFIEEDCKISLNGREFKSGGSYIAKCSDGFYRGIIYANKQKNIVSTWHGETIADARFGRIYQGNFCKMQNVSFYYENKLFTGKYCPDSSDSVKVKSTKREQQTKGA